MTISQDATRKQIRVAVGRNLGAVTLIAAALGGSTTTFLTDDLPGTSADSYKGRRWLGTDSPNDGIDARVTGSAVASNRTTLTLFPAVTSTLSDDTAELWDPEWNPENIHDFINQAIREITGIAYDPEESLALHADGRQMRFDIPSQFAMLNRIDFRHTVEAVQVDAATALWDEISAPTGVTYLQDNEDFKRGSASFRMAITSAASTGLLATKKIASKNITGMDYLEFWIKCTIATSAADLQLLLDDTAACVSVIETLDVPALVADSWTYVRVALATPELDTALISVGLNYTVDIGACTIWLNDVKAVRNNSGRWGTLAKNLWGVDLSTRDLVIKPSGRSSMGYALMKLVGGDRLATLDSDSTVCEVDDWYVIARATALAMKASPKEELRSKSRDWELLAQQAKAAHHLPFNTRLVS